MGTLERIYPSRDKEGSMKVELNPSSTGIPASVGAARRENLAELEADVALVRRGLLFPVTRDWVSKLVNIEIDTPAGCRYNAISFSK
jgi:hypothetical protein